MSTGDVFHTSDLWLASFFLSRGATLLRAEGGGRNGKVSFIFGDRNTCESLAVEYANDGPVGFATARSNMEALKNLVFSRVG